jgi:hypothetical protein
MIFETAIKITIVDKKGNDKVVTNKYIVENAELFGEVEGKLYEEFGNFPNFVVLSIKTNNKIREVINEKPDGDDECKIFYATICDFFTDDNGKTKEIPYVVVAFAHDMTEAKAAVDQYMRQGLEDMELKAIKETKFINVLG